jgi:hypothetical protein
VKRGQECRGVGHVSILLHIIAFSTGDTLLAFEALESRASLNRHDLHEAIFLRIRDIISNVSLTAISLMPHFLCPVNCLPPIGKLRRNARSRETQNAGYAPSLVLFYRILSNLNSSRTSSFPYRCAATTSRGYKLQKYASSPAMSIDL